MTDRSDISVQFTLDPRLAEIDAPSVEVSVQDSHDTLTGRQDSVEGMRFPDLVDTAGGESLGGGTTVGLTTSLLNVQYAFSRTASRCSGTVTTGDSILLIDSGATFITDSVARGDWVINFTDQSVTEVLSVDSETQLTVRTLTDGTSNTFTSSDVYKVWEVSECSLVGGNFVATDDVGGDLNPLFTTFGRFATRTSSSSATALSQDSLEFGLFQGGVAFDISSIYTLSSQVSGVVGTREYPLNNIADVVTLATDRGLRQIFVMASATIASTDLSTLAPVFKGDNEIFTITVSPSANVTSCSFHNLTIAGELDGMNTVEGCIVEAVTNVSGVFRDCSFSSTVSQNGDTLYKNCTSYVAGTGYPIITSGAHEVQVRNWSGSFGVSGMTAGTHTIHMSGGQVHFDNTCSGGTAYIRGEYSAAPDDQSTGTSVVDQTNTTVQLREMYKLLGLDASDAVSMSGDGTTSKTATVGGFTVTFTPTSITRT
jgi:hypothetical protein